MVQMDFEMQEKIKYPQEEKDKLKQTCECIYLSHWNVQ